MSRFFSISLSIILVMFIGFIVLSLISPPRETVIKNLPEDSSITIFAVGDIMPDRGVEYKIQ